MLHGELETHLDYSKHEKSDNSNSWNGTTSKRIKSEYGESIIEIPRDRDRSFEPIIVPKHQSKSVSVENMVISLYAKGLIVSDIES